MAHVHEPTVCTLLTSAVTFLEMLRDQVQRECLLDMENKLTLTITHSATSVPVYGMLRNTCDLLSSPGVSLQYVCVSSERDRENRPL